MLSHSCFQLGKGLNVHVAIASLDAVHIDVSGTSAAAGATAEAPATLKRKPPDNAREILLVIYSSAC
jgi:hypothetical protein